MNCIIFENESFCDAPAELNHEGLFLCPDHSLARQMANKKTKALAARSATEKTGVYVLEIPVYSTLKIGRAVDLKRRLGDLHRDFRLGSRHRLNLLAFQSDLTYQDETNLHLLFWDFLLTDREGEQFEDVPEIRSEALAMGIDGQGQYDYERYLRANFGDGAKYKSLYLPPSMR